MILYGSEWTGIVYTEHFKDKVQDMLSETLKIIIQKCEKQQQKQ